MSESGRVLDYQGKGAVVALLPLFVQSPQQSVSATNSVNQGMGEGSPSKGKATPKGGLPVFHKPEIYHY